MRVKRNLVVAVLAALGAAGLGVYVSLGDPVTCPILVEAKLHSVRIVATYADDRAIYVYSLPGLPHRNAAALRSQLELPANRLSALPPQAPYRWGLTVASDRFEFEEGRSEAGEVLTIMTKSHKATLRDRIIALFRAASPSPTKGSARVHPIVRGNPQ